MERLILLALVLTGCENQPNQHHLCNCAQSEKVVDFVVKNTGPANNMSDEEMEDVIKRIETVGIRQYCPQRIFWEGNSGIDWKDPRNNLDSCESVFTYVY